MMKRNQDAYDRWSMSYDSDPNPQTAMEQNAVIELVSPSAGDRILDAACGTGRYCRLFQESGSEVVGIDFSEGMLNVARAQLPDIEFHQMDLTLPLEFGDESFNKVNCAQALKHLSEIQATLKEFARVITNTGTITFSVTHPEMHWEDYEMSSPSSFNLAAESDIHHHRFYDYFEAIENAGLRLSNFRQVAIDEQVKQYLKADSYNKVKGRYQIAIFQLTKTNVERGSYRRLETRA